jgi:Holliday junction resolvasome RuvABC ATP-dependent DNA helicase subunit
LSPANTKNGWRRKNGLRYIYCGCSQPKKLGLHLLNPASIERCAAHRPKADYAANVVPWTCCEFAKMNDLNAKLQQFVTAYKSRSIPPPHILFIGQDDARSASLAADFASQLGVKFQQAEASKIDVQGDMTVLATCGGVALIGNIQNLKKIYIQKLERDLPRGMYEVVIGTGPSMRTHLMDIAATTIIATCPTKYDCPPQLLKVFETILTVEPLTTRELAGVLEQEAWKDKIELNPDASELLVRVGCGRTDTMLHQFRRVCGAIDQLKTTNRPRFSGQEVREALERLRIKIPPAINPKAAFNIHALTGHEFEYAVKVLLTEMGFEAELTEVTGDGGIDIIAKLDKPFVGGRYLFQCKRYSDGNMVGASEVRDFYGAVMADRAIKGIFITTSDFTSQAKEFAAQSGLELVNLPKLMQLFEVNGLKRYL